MDLTSCRLCFLKIHKASNSCSTILWRNLQFVFVCTRKSNKAPSLPVLFVFIVWWTPAHTYFCFFFCFVSFCESNLRLKSFAPTWPLTREKVNSKQSKFGSWKLQTSWPFFHLDAYSRLRSSFYKYMTVIAHQSSAS